MNDYQVSALGQGLIFIVVLLIAFFVYYFSSQNREWYQRLLVSIYPAIFILGEVYALIASSFYEKGSWENGIYVPTQMGANLTYILYGIFSLGVVMALYSIIYFKGDKLYKFIIVPACIVAFVLFFIAGMTLTRDWI